MSLYGQWLLLYANNKIRTAKVVESREIIREGRPRRLVETVEVSRESSRRPPSIAGSGFETSRNSSRDRPRIM